MFSLLSIESPLEVQCIIASSCRGRRVLRMAVPTCGAAATESPPPGDDLGRSPPRKASRATTAHPARSCGRRRAPSHLRGARTRVPAAPGRLCAPSHRPEPCLSRETRGADRQQHITGRSTWERLCAAAHNRCGRAQGATRLAGRLLLFWPLRLSSRMPQLRKGRHRRSRYRHLACPLFPTGAVARHDRVHDTPRRDEVDATRRHVPEVGRRYRLRARVASAARNTLGVIAAALRFMERSAWRRVCRWRRGVGRA